MACVASEHLRLLDPLGFALRQDSLVAVWQTLQENKLCLAAVRQGEVQTSLLATRQDATDVSADDWGAKRCKILRKDMTQLCSERSDAGWVSARRKTSRPAASSCGSVDAGSRPPKSPRSRSPGSEGGATRITGGVAPAEPPQSPPPISAPKSRAVSFRTLAST